MIPIKYRAWDKKRKELYHWDKVRQWTFDQVSQPQEYDEDIIFMQFTGLLDKNGKEIFESDLIERKGRVCFVKWFTSPSFCGWDLYYIRGATNDNDPEKGGLWNGWEIIGNIYENPELK